MKNEKLMEKKQKKTKTKQKKLAIKKQLKTNKQTQIAKRKVCSRGGDIQESNERSLESISNIQRTGAQERNTHNNCSKVKNDTAKLLYLFVVVVTSISSTFLFSSCHVVEAKGWNNFLFETHTTIINRYLY